MDSVHAPTASELVPRWEGGGFSGAWRLDADGQSLACDEEVAAALGLAMSSTLTAFLNCIAPADRATVAAAIGAARRDGQRIDRHFRLAGVPAHGQWARLSAGAHAGVLLGALTDLPGEGPRLDLWRDAETRFRQAFDQTAQTAVQGYDRQRRVIYWNAASERLYGWRVNEALGRLLEELIIPAPMRDEVVRLHTAWVERNQAIPAAELELMHKDGSPVAVFSSHVMLHNARGEPEMYCVDVDLRPQREALAIAMRR